MRKNRQLSAKSMAKKVEPYLYIAPAILLVIVFTYYPFLKTVLLSTTVVSSMGEAGQFVGLDNYLRIFKDKAFLDAIANTLKFVFISVPISIALALGLALLAEKQRKMSKLYETMYTIPMAMSVSITMLIFQFMMNPGLGIINYWLGTDIAWFTDKKYLLVAVIIISVWMSIGMDFLFLLAAVRNVPVDLVEYAKLEGATGFHRFRSITLPLISPTLFFLVCTEFAKAMMMATPLIIANRATASTGKSAIQTVMYYMYTQAFTNSNYSYAFAAAVVGFILTFGLLLLSFVFEKKGVYYS